MLNEDTQLISFCSSCGAKLTPGARFCPSCGAPLGEKTVSGPKNSGSRAGLFIVLGIVLFNLLGLGGYLVYTWLDNSSKDEMRALALAEHESRKAREEASSVQQSATTQVQHRQHDDLDARTYNSGAHWVVSTGEGLRLRYKPSESAAKYRKSNGREKHLHRGDCVEYLGEVDGWYKVRFEGNELWVSKKFSYSVD